MSGVGSHTKTGDETGCLLSVLQPHTIVTVVDGANDFLYMLRNNQIYSVHFCVLCKHGGASRKRVNCITPAFIDVYILNVSATQNRARA